jgi:hypothetical protein
MIPFLLKLLQRLAAAIESAAEREQKKCEQALKDAADLVQKANGHRTTTRQARQVAAALKDVTSVPAPAAPTTDAAPQ